MVWILSKRIVVFYYNIVVLIPKLSRQTVRRQTLWNHLTLFLSDTFLPVTSPV